MAKPRGTDGSLLGSLPWTLTAIGFALLAHLPYLPVWIPAVFFGCAVWRIVIERRRVAVPSVWVRATLALVGFLGVLATYDTISGVGPGSALLAIMAALKLLETRQRRDQFVLLFISLFLVMAALLREQYLWSLPYLFVAVLLIMTAWLRMAADRAESLGQSLATGGRLLAYALPLAVAMWIFFPRISSPFWSVPIDTSSGVTGLSNQMSPGDISSLSQSDALAFRVKFDGDAPPPAERYWRGLVLYQFNGRSWTGGDPLGGRPATEQIEFEGEPVRYRITLEPTNQQWVLALELPYDWTLPRTRMGFRQQLYNVYPIDQRVAYEVLSYPAYRSQASVNVRARAWYTDLPERGNPRTRALATEMRARAGSDQAFIQDVLTRFNQEDFYYTLRPPALGNNPVDRFLFDTRRGFCEHYASAFAVMMRAAGIPARVVLGYQGGEFNPLSGQYLVRQSDAHAWTEVWLQGEGWRRVDPTAAVAPARVELGVAGAVRSGVGATWGLSTPSQLLHRLTLSWDALNARWNEWVLGYGTDTQGDFMRWLGMDEPNWRNMVLTMLAIVFGLAFLIGASLTLRFRPPEKDRAALLYGRFVRKTGLTPATGETPSAFARRVTATYGRDEGPVRTFTDAYLDTRYGRLGPSALKRLETALAEIPRYSELKPRFRRRARP